VFLWCAEPAHDAVGTAKLLDLLHGAFTSFLTAADPFADDAVQRATRVIEPALRLVKIECQPGESRPVRFSEPPDHKLELGAAFGSGLSIRLPAVAVARQSKRISRAGVSIDSIRTRRSFAAQNVGRKEM
jgi:hypothetical protein